jgi:hypothetical protein
MLSDNAQKMSSCRIMYEPCVLSLLKRHIFEAYWQNIQQKHMVYRICLPLGETVGPVICPSETNTSQSVPQCYPSIQLNKNITHILEV